MSYPLVSGNRVGVVDHRNGRSASRPDRVRPQRKVRLGRLLAVIFLAWAVFLFAAQEVRMVRLRAEEAGIRAEINRLQAENEALAAQLKQVQSDEYIEKVAREQLGLVKEGEIPYFNGAPGDPGDAEPGSGY